MLVSVVARDGVARDSECAPLEPFARALCEAGFLLIERRAATSDDVVDLWSSWARRLGIPARRPAWVVTARR